MGPQFRAQVAALELAVEQGLLAVEERKAAMDTVYSSYAGGIAYFPFDVLQHVTPHPRFAQIRALYREA